MITYSAGRLKYIILSHNSFYYSQNYSQYKALYKLATINRYILLRFMVLSISKGICSELCCHAWTPVILYCGFSLCKEYN